MTSSRTENGVAPATAGALIDVTMPQMGVSVAEGTVVAWRVAVGDRVAMDETVCEITTDKIDTEVPAPAAGVVAEILVDVDETVSVGTVLARVAVPSAAGGGERSGAPSGEPVPSGSPGREPSAASGSPGREPSAASGSRGRERPAPSEAATGSNGSGSNGHDGRHYSPVVQRIAAAHGIDLATVAGTGRNGRVRKQDVMALVSPAPGSAAAARAAEGGVAQSATTESGAAEIAEPPLHIESPYRPEPVSPRGEVAPRRGTAPAGAQGSGQLSRMRRSIGEHMKRSLETAATCTTWIEADMARVEARRRELGLTALAYVARACVLALREHPALNAWVEGERYTRFDREVHLGIAVSLGEDGLIVPVVRNAHELSVEGLAARIRDLAGRARTGALSPDEVRGGTFTITNPGQFGSIMATPIINQPQVGILDLEAVVKRPVVVAGADGEDVIAIRPMTILGLSWDHRALDGAQSAQFLATVRRHLESGSL